MHSHSPSLVLCAALALTTLLTPALCGQTTVTCNGLPATIVAVSPGEIVGTQGDDVIVGTSRDDRIFGLGGNDTICGLGGNDQITGGQGNDTLFGQDGNNTFFWSPGDGSDRMDGSAGIDTLHMVGSQASETVELSANGARLRLFRNVANIVLDVGSVERVNFAARGGSDLIVVNTPAGAGVQQLTLDLEGFESNIPDGQPDSIIVFGSTRNDQMTIAGSGSTLNITGAGPAIQIRNSEGALDSLSVYGIDGNDQINAQGLAAGLTRLIIEGGPGNDTITGSRASDALVGGEGDDTFVWTVGSPADGVGGGAGTDTLQVVGTAAADNVVLSAGAVEAHVLNAADGVAFPADVEQIFLQARGGADQITVNTLAGAPLLKIALDLRPSTTVTTGDGNADTILLNGTPGADNVNITGAAGSLTVSGLAPTVVIQGSESVRDTLTVNTGFESDVLNAKGLAADAIRLVVRGGPGNDTITGSLGGDLFTWVPGDNSDVIEGELGNDTLQVTGSQIGEKLSFTANGRRLRLTRDIASVVLDVNGVERVNLAAQGGADTVSFVDLSGAAVRQVAVDLAGPAGSGGDGQPDAILITAQTTSPIATSLGNGTITTSWSSVKISVTGVEAANDRLILQTIDSSVPTMISAAQGESTAAGGEEARP